MPTVTINGETHEVELDAITFGDDETPSGFVSTAKMNETVKREKAKAKRSLRTQLEQDDEFKAQILDQYGIELREDGTVKGSPKDSAQLEERWKAKHLAPLQAQLDAATKAAQTARQRSLDADIVAAARAQGVAEAMLKPLPGADAPPIVQHLRGSFVFDEETGQWGARGDDDSLRFGTGGKPVGPQDLLAELKADETYSPWFTPTQMKGAGHQQTPSGGSGRTWSTAEIEAMSLDEFAKHEADITAAQREGRITD